MCRRFFSLWPLQVLHISSVRFGGVVLGDGQGIDGFEAGGGVLGKGVHQTGYESHLWLKVPAAVVQPWRER